MNSAASHSASLINAFEGRQEAASTFEYPAPHAFGATRPGPFGGTPCEQPSLAGFVQPCVQMAHGNVDSGTSQLTEWDTSFGAGPSRRPPPLSQFDYAAGWGAQTHHETGGLTQESAARIATLQAKLNQRLGPEYLSQRPGPGGGKKLTYIEGWKLVDLANEVFGFNGWSTTIVRIDVDFLDAAPDGSRFSCGVSCVVRVTLRDGAFHEDIGYGSVDNARQKHAALEKCKKEAVTDATKRTLKNFGKLLGNCTYDHQWSMQALKVVNPAPKFDASELHRRPELRAMPQAQPQPQPQPPPVPQPQPPPQLNPTITRPLTTSTAPNTVSAKPNAVRTDTMAPPIKSTAAQNAKETTGGEADAAALRQQRSILARKAYLEKQQQAEAQRSAASVPLKAVTTTAEAETGLDLFDEDLSDVLAHYDETDVEEAEAASMALELELEMDERNTRKNENSTADDSGIVMTDHQMSMVVPKQEKTSVVEARRSMSPIKQIKAEVVQPRRAGSVGRFISPPPSAAAAGPGASIKNGCTSLSASSRIIGAKEGSRPDFGAMRPSRSSLTDNYRAANAVGSGVEAARVKEAGRATGQAVNHNFMPAAQVLAPPRSALKRPSEDTLDHQERPAAMVRQT